MKQFPPTVPGRGCYQNELNLVRYLQSVVRVPELVLDDDVWLITTTRYAGDSLWLHLLQDRPPPAHFCEELADALGRLHSVSVPSDVGVTGVPAVCRWMEGDQPECPSPAQVQVLRALCGQPAMNNAAGMVADAWEATKVIHGDAKLEHIAVGVDGPTLVDFETAGLGWPAWDHAGVIQSALTFHVRRAAGGDLTVPAWLRDLVRVFIMAAPTGVDLLFAAVAVRLAQTACEWETGQDRPSMQTALVAQLAASIAADPSAAVPAFT